jgi:hypothetical protein
MNANTLANASEFQSAILEMIDGKTATEYRVSGTPTPEFWDMWENKKSAMKAAGFSVSKVDGFFVCGVMIFELCKDMTESQAAYVSQKKADEKAFWKSGEGRDIAPSGR